MIHQIQKGLTVCLVGIFSFTIVPSLLDAAETTSPTKVKSAPVQPEKKKKAFKKSHKKSAAKIERKKKRKSRKMRHSLKAWLKKMKKRVARSHAKHNQITAVGAVRGSETPDSPPLYWKGKKSKGPIDLPELEEFDKAIKNAISGDKAEAIRRLEKFQKTYPNSSLKGDAEHTLQMLRETPN